MTPHKGTSNRRPSTRLRDPRHMKNLLHVEEIIRVLLLVVPTPPWREQDYQLRDSELLHLLVRGPGAVRMGFNRLAGLPVESIRAASDHLQQRYHQRNK